MNTINLFSLLSLLPIFYPLAHLYKKDDLNLWDFLLLFSVFFFTVLPFIYGSLISFESEIVFKVSVVLFIFQYLLFIIDYNFRKSHGNEFRLLNVCYYLRHIKQMRINFLGKLLIAVGLVASVVFYLPRMSLAVRLEESGMNFNYTESSIAMAMTSVVSIIGVILTMVTLTNLKHLKNDKFLIILDIIYMGLMFFMPRRMLVFAILEFIIVFYAIHREKINKRLFLYGTILTLGFIFLYFPFYNVLRLNKVNFNSRHPIESLAAVVNYGMKNYSLLQSKASQSTDERTLGLYQALYNLFHNCTEWGNGSLTVAAIDGAIPRVINHGKGKGTEPILEKMSGAYNDQADSILLEACGDFGSLGSVYAILLFYFLFWLYEKYSYFYYKVFRSYLVPTFLMFELLSITWNIEGNFGGRISFIFSSIFSIILLLIIERYQIIVIKRRHFIKVTKNIKNIKVEEIKSAENENSISLS